MNQKGVGRLGSFSTPIYILRLLYRGVPIKSFVLEFVELIVERLSVPDYKPSILWNFIS